MKRWTNVWYVFTKFSKNEKEEAKSGAGASKVKICLQWPTKMFKKLYITRNVEDNFEKDDDKIDNPEVEDNIYHKDSTEAIRIKKADQDLGSFSKKLHKHDELEHMMLKILQSEMSNWHLSFFHGIIHALENFNDDEVLKFQMGVL